MADKLTVGMVLDTSLDPPDGVQQYVISVGEWLRNQGHEVHYLVGETKHRDELPNVHSLSRNIPVRSNGNRTTIPLFAKRSAARAVLRENRFDILHVQVPHHPFMAQRLVLAADKRTAIIGTFHIVSYGWLETLGTKLLGWLLRPSLRRFDTMISVSPAAASFARQTFGVDSEVLPNVIDYPLFHRAKPFKRYDDDTLTVMFFGRLVPRKGALVLLQAVATLAKRDDIPGFRLLICGKGPEAGTLQEFIDEHGLNDRVEMTGFVSEADKPRYYASADISVFPSSGGESFGIVLLEAMASGHAAVLAGDNPGYRSVMAPRPGLLFDPRDSDALAELLANYLRDSVLRDGTRSWGERYTKEFDVATVGAKLVALYRQALRKHRQT